MFKATHDARIHSALARGEVTTDPTTGLVLVRSVSPRLRPDGYLTVTIQGTPVSAHRVMWLAHHPSTPPSMQINHRNKIRHDNRLSNLELVTVRDNSLHAHGHQYAAVADIDDDDNTVDTAWFEQVMLLAQQPDVTSEQIQALKTAGTLNDSAPAVFAVRRLTRRLH